MPQRDPESQVVPATNTREGVAGEHNKEKEITADPQTLCKSSPRARTVPDTPCTPIAENAHKKTDLKANTTLNFDTPDAVSIVEIDEED